MYTLPYRNGTSGTEKYPWHLKQRQKKRVDNEDFVEK
jgi:hypothetical protein